MLTTVHSPFDVRIFHREACSLARAGFKVTVIAPCDADTERDGVQVRAVPRPVSRWHRITLTAQHVLVKVLCGNYDVVHFHDPELIPVGACLAILGYDVVYDAHEHYFLRIQSKEWIATLLRPVLARAVWLVEQCSAVLFRAVVGAWPEIVSQFPRSKAVLVANRPPLSEITGLNRIPYALRPAHVVYVGGIERARGIGEMLQAAARVREKMECTLVLAGRAPIDLLDAITSESVRGFVEFRGQLDRGELADVLCTGRVGLLLLHPTPQYLLAESTKVYEYMAAGMPVVLPRFPLWERLVEKYRCGIVADPLDPAEVASAIEWLLSNPAEAEAMGQRGRAGVLSDLNWEVEERKLLDLYTKFANGQ